MIKGNFKYYIFSGILFTYYGLKGEFVLLYSGTALFMAWASFFIAFSNYNKENSRDE
ncbi:hypothetical protein [Maribacter sp. 2304DJ31-5]|uniref:hypothetical protein n=1 Tax=Maribacter sp. 2304DJ31-5 TaxID=3386273 RepID=UPI0039BCB233